ncbi:MAG: NfeD family protein [Spirochaetes bacterium]|nr:NfeD family protein [Spirochaetota bacterium]
MKKIITFPVWIAYIIIFLWILKDIIIFPRVWQSYDSRKVNYKEYLIGVKGVAVDDLNPEGYVKIKGELWKAEIADSEAHVKKGEEIRVLKVENMKLFVSPDFHN